MIGYSPSHDILSLHPQAPQPQQKASMSDLPFFVPPNALPPEPPHSGPPLAPHNRLLPSLQPPIALLDLSPPCLASPATTHQPYSSLLPATSAVSSRSTPDSSLRNHLKRAKTPRACDSCRAKKIRCELADPTPGTRPSDPCRTVCVYCRLHHIDCTWFLPITETRFKRKRPDRLPIDTVTLLPPDAPAGPDSSVPRRPVEHLPPRRSSPLVSAQPLPAPRPPCPPPTSNSSSPTPSAPEASRPLHPGTKPEDTRMYGSTSMSFIMHNTCPFPPDQIADYDRRFLQTLERPNGGQPYIRVLSDAAAENDSPSEDDGSAPATEETGSRPFLGPTTAQSLLDAYFSLPARLFPLLTRAEFRMLTAESAGARLFYSVCCIGAMGHSIGPVVRRRIREKVYEVYRAEDLLQLSDIPTIIALLLAGYSIEFEGTKVSKMAWTAIGAAVRMAQSLGMHRSSTLEHKTLEYRRLRQRVWSCCIIADRWVSMMFGLPMSIDLADCDVIFPDQPEVGGFDEARAMVELSILLGKVVKLLYSPTGTLNVTDDQLESLVDALELWQGRLPDSPTSPAQTWTAGHLRLYAIPVSFLLRSPFVYSKPAGLRFTVSDEELEQMRVETAECIRWVQLYPAFLEGYAIGLYSFFICCLVQYKSYIRRFHQATLDIIACAKAILELVSTPDCHVRKRVWHVVQVLHCSASSIGRKAIQPKPSPLPQPTLQLPDFSNWGSWLDLLSNDRPFLDQTNLNFPSFQSLMPPTISLQNQYEQHYLHQQRHAQQEQQTEEQVIKNKPADIGSNESLEQLWIGLGLGRDFF